MRKALGVAVFSGMLGVTLFGLALTPVFFATIDSLAEAHLFASSRLRLVSDFVLAVLSLGPLRRWGGKLRGKPAQPATRASAVSKLLEHSAAEHREDVSQQHAPHASAIALDEAPQDMSHRPAEN
jgi:hypothetical protein